MLIIVLSSYLINIIVIVLCMYVNFSSVRYIKYQTLVLGLVSMSIKVSQYIGLTVLFYLNGPVVTHPVPICAGKPGWPSLTHVHSSGMVTWGPKPNHLKAHSPVTQLNLMWAGAHSPASTLSAHLSLINFFLHCKICILCSRSMYTSVKGGYCRG